VVRSMSSLMLVWLSAAGSAGEFQQALDDLGAARGFLGDKAQVFIKLVPFFRASPA